MDISEDILMDERYKSQIEKISDKNLKLIVEDPIKTLKMARQGILKVEPEKANDLEYIQAMADTMQRFAQKVLQKRTEQK